ncbi:MAG: PAS domain-containing protein [Bacteriovoracaceae bacterium]|nr:PAS domain-containing protein [Bacteriovoracaceae bacterium]
MNIKNETLFGFDEIFFSRTDKRGVILSGNSVFKRISGYDWNELIDRPHNVVRHQDMPKAVFYLLWEMLKAGEPVGAFVKNQSKDGCYYWVFALAIPIKQGYLSIRIKPGSEILEVIKGEYQKLLAIEKNQKLAPAQSCQELLKVLHSLGFPDYKTFMTTALLSEIKNRQKKLSRPEIPILVRLNELLSKSDDLLKNSQELEKNFIGSILLPLNLAIQADKLDEEGAPLAVVASRYTVLINEIQTEFKRFEETCQLVQKSVSECQYVLAAAVLESEVINFFKNEKITDGILNVESEMKILEQVSLDGINISLDTLCKIKIEFDQFISTCEQLRMVATGLDIVRLTGKIEVARLNRNREQLDHLVTDLFKFKQYLDSSIKDSSGVAEIIRKRVVEIHEHLTQKKGSCNLILD